MSGAGKAHRTKTALKVLKRAVNHFSKTFPDPSELEAIGYEVITDTLDKEPKGKDNWEGFIEKSLRNAFRNHIKKCNIRNSGRISMDEFNDMEDGKDGRTVDVKATHHPDYGQAIMDKNRIEGLLKGLPKRQREAVEYYLATNEIPGNRDAFNDAIKTIRKNFV